MKKSLLVVAVMLFILVPFVAQSQLEVGKSVAGPTIGLSFLGSAFQFGANYEYITKMDFGTVGIGGVFRYWSYSEGYFFGEWKYSNILIGAQGNYHFKIEANKWDPWVGLVLAYDGSSVSWSGPAANYSSPTSGGLFLGAQGGARYWFSPTMAVRATIGVGSLSYGGLDLGLDFKF